MSKYLEGVKTYDIIDIDRGSEMVHALRMQVTNRSLSTKEAHKGTLSSLENPPFLKDFHE